MRRAWGRWAAAAALVVAATPAAGRAQGQGGAGGRFPAEIRTTVVYRMDGTDDRGVPNMPQCRSEGWTASLRLELRLKGVARGEAEYETTGGSWSATGSCRGEYSWEQADGELCTWTTTGALSGSGAFTRGGETSASLYLRPDGTYQVTFLLQGVRSARSWDNPCRTNGSAESITMLTGSVQDVRYTLDGGALALAPTGRRRSTNDNVDGVYDHRWTVGEAATDDVTVAIDGPACACIDAEKREGQVVRYTARASTPGGTFSRFQVASAGDMPREVSNTSGRAAELQIAPNRHTGRVELRVRYTVNGREHVAQRTVSFCAMDSVTVAGGSDDLTFDDAAEPRLVVEAASQAWVDGAPATPELKWTLEEMGDGTRLSPSEASGAAARFTYTGLPEQNAAFGPKRLEARLQRDECDCRRSREVRTFFRALARNHPHAGDGADSPYHGLPNWLYYWSQTSAMQRIPVGKLRYVEGLNDGGGNAVGARYVDEADRILVSEAVFLRPCIGRLDRATRRPTGQRSEGIDCFGETMRHEWQHRSEWLEWWPDGEPSGLSDPDMDGVPHAVEARTAGCSSRSQMSCADRPFPALVSDREILAYWVGWSWPIGSADREDWSCNGKQWRGGACGR